jgi:ATP phosphoribosyltransferase regulatory subunit
LEEYAQSKGIGGIIYINGEDAIEIHNLKTGEIEKTTVSELSGR